MRAAAAGLNYLFLKHIKCFHSLGYVCLFKLVITELAVRVATPNVNFSLGDIVRVGLYNRGGAANCGSEVGATRDLLNPVAFQCLDKDWRSSRVQLLDLILS